MSRLTRNYSYDVPPEHRPVNENEDDPSTAVRSVPSSPQSYRQRLVQGPEQTTGYGSLRDQVEIGETTSLLGKTYENPAGTRGLSYASIPGLDTHGGRGLATGSLRRSRHHSRTNSQIGKLASRRASMDMERPDSVVPSLKDGMSASMLDERAWYDQFTSTDWVHDSIADGARLRQLRQRKDIRGRILARVDGAQGWVLVAVIGCITAAIAYFVDVSDGFIFDLKQGFCTTRWFQSRNVCCQQAPSCDDWYTWSMIFSPSDTNFEWVNFGMFVLWVVVLSVISCFLTLITKTVVPSTVSLAMLDENLAAESSRGRRSDIGTLSPDSPSGTHISPPVLPQRPAKVYYPAAGSGVAEVKVINSGFILHGYLGFKTLVVKTLALVFSVSSGLSLGKEGPYVHIGACVGNICCRIFSKYNLNDGKRREVISASAASGVAVAFGAPIGGVLFSLEEVSYYFPPKTLFRTFFCCIASALSLKFLNPYGTGKIVLFEVRYLSDWEVFEMILFVLLGIMGGAAGALFIKASSFWAKSFRRISIIKRWPMFEVVLVGLLTGALSYWNHYTKLPVSELLYELARPCDEPDSALATGLCPRAEGIGEIIRYLSVAFVIKSILTIVTFGIKVPAGIYVPSMVVGGLMGRIVGHTVQYLAVEYPSFFLFEACPAYTGMESCVTPGVYALIAAGATMCGVTRLSVTLPVILFELTGSLNHVLPFSIAVLCAKWTADAIEPRSIYVRLRLSPSHATPQGWKLTRYAGLIDRHEFLSIPRQQGPNLIRCSPGRYRSSGTQVPFN